ncbi:UDP-glycosyltransferase [Nymphaea thermarum]|nr:UDP-glycosyltransferase [Nymphaea thermarum]
MEDDKRDQPLQVVMFPSLAFGHIFPFVHLSNALAAKGLNVTFLTLPSLVPKIRLSLDPNIPILSYKLPPIDGLPSDIYSTNGCSELLVELLRQAMDATRPQIAKILAKLSPQVVVFDFVQCWVPEVAELLGIKSDQQESLGWVVHQEGRKESSEDRSKKGKEVRANNSNFREILQQEGLQEDYTKGFITMLTELATKQCSNAR